MDSVTTAAFLDRDGTLNVEKGYIRVVDDLELLPGAAQAVRHLNDHGILAILTTNQSGVARGFYDEDHLHALHARLEKLLWDQAQAKLDAIYYSPYLPHGSVDAFAKDSPCRKPNTGMIDAACERFPGIDRKASYVFGDKVTDVDFAHNAGCHSVLLKTGYGTRVLEGKYQTITTPPEYVFDTILDAVKALFP